MAEQLLLPELKGFNVNEGVSEEAADVCRLTGADVFSAQQYAEFWTSVKKSMGGGTELAKASYYQIMPPNTQSFSRINYMPTSAAGEFGILQWPGIPPDTLEKMSREHVGILMLVGLRQDDVLRYADVSEFPWRPGWQIKPKRGVPLDSSVRKEIQEATEFLINGGIGGVYNDPRERDALSRVDFSKFLGEIVRSSLVYDGIAVWTEFDNADKIVSFSPYPAQNIRLVANEPNANTSKQTNFLNVYANSTLSNLGGDNTNISRIPPYFAVAVDDTGNIISKFTRKQMVWYTRNSRVDAYVNGYGFPEAEMGVTLVNGFTNAIKFNCYSEDTEVLTSNGWKLFKDVDIDTDIFATLNSSNGELEYQKASRKIWEPYEGDMYELKSRSIDQLVTPNHNLLLQSKYVANTLGLDNVNNRERHGKFGRKPNIPIYKTISAEEFYNESSDYQPTIWKTNTNCNKSKYSEYWQIPVTAKWTGISIKEKTFKHIDGSILTMTGDQYCAFMGMYLAEGSSSPTRISIAQCKHSIGYTPYKNLLSSVIKSEPQYYNNSFHLNNSGLAKYLILFGKDCYSKKIPDDIMNATPEQITIFWDHYLLGDGNTQFTNSGIFKTTRRGDFDGRKFRITTTSKKITHQFQELAIKMGYSASITVRKEHECYVPVLLKKAVGDWEYDKESRKLCNAVESYEICLKSTRAHPFSISKISYKGNIGCVTVPNHTLFIRRNNKVSISKNSDIFDKNAVPKGILTIKGQFCFSEDTEVLTKRGWLSFDKVDVDIDEIATLNKENSNFEWQKATDKKVWEPYSGTMYQISSRSIDMLVTPNHWVLLTDRYKKDGAPNTYRLVQAENLYNKCYGNRSTRRAIPVTATWTGTEVGSKVVEIVNKSKFDSQSYSISMSGDDYCAFMGMYLSEGSVTGSNSSKEYPEGRPATVVITQFEKSKGFLPYKNLLTRILGKEPVHDGKNFYVCSSALTEHVSQFGHYANTKTIPTEILNATPRQLKIFWDYYEMGDGSSIINNNGKNSKITGRLNGKTHQIDTTSKVMADQLQEVACKMGYSATMISDYERVGKTSSFIDQSGNVKTIKSTHPCFRVRLVSTPSHEFRIKKVENYNGYIGCVTVPNHIIYVRRNGKVGFSGQTQRQFDALGRVWDNIQRGINNAWSLPAIMLSEKGSIELVSLEKLRGEPVYYNNLINLFVGAMCVLWRIPVHRLGYKISGTERDSRPDTPKSIMEEDDVGLPVLLGHIEKLINVYILKSRWPFLQFYFTGKSPKEDARLYEARMLSMSLKEKRNMMGDCAWVDLAEGEEEKQVARWMDLAPVDPALAGIYQSIIAARAKELTGGAGGGGMRGAEPKEMPGARFTSKIDPARSESQGHVSGIRRDSAEEKPSTAKPSIPTSNTSGQQKIG